MLTGTAHVVFRDFPNFGKEMVVLNEDGSYTVFINTRLNYEQQMKAYLHAMKHITGDDFQKDDVQSIEYLAHG